MGSLYLGNNKVTVAQTWATADLDKLTSQDKTVTPTASVQTVSVDTGYDMLGTVTIKGVTSSIDTNLVASNVREGTEILDIVGTLQPSLPTQVKTATLYTKSAAGTNTVSVNADNGFTMSKVIIPTVDNTIDENITAENIKSGVSILGVTGTYETPTTATTITPSKSLQIVTPSTGYVFNQVTVPAVTSSIDSNITAENIKSGKTILGIAGTYETPTKDAYIAPSVSQQIITPDSGYHLGTVYLSKVTSDIDSNITADNIKAGKTILGVEGTYQPSLGAKTISSSITTKTYLAETDGYDGFSSVTVNAPKLVAISVVPSHSTTSYIAKNSNYDGYSKVTVTGCTNLKAANIVKDVNIFDTIGTAKVRTYKSFDTTVANYTKEQSISGAGYTNTYFGFVNSDGIAMQIKLVVDTYTEAPTITYTEDGYYNVVSDANITQMWIFINTPKMEQYNNTYVTNQYYDSTWMRNAEFELIFPDGDSRSNYVSLSTSNSYSSVESSSASAMAKQDSYNLNSNYGIEYGIKGLIDSKGYSQVLGKEFQIRVRYADYEAD